MKTTIYSMIAVCIVSIYACKKNQDEKIVTEDVIFTKEGELTVFKTKDTILPVRFLAIEIADNEFKRQTGLMYRKSMEDQQAMLFVFPESKPQSFYMRNTLIPLDIIYIDEQYKIVSVQKNAKPLDNTSLPSEKAAKYVLEINGGLFDQWQLKVGDSISYKKI